MNRIEKRNPEPDRTFRSAEPPNPVIIGYIGLPHFDSQYQRGVDINTSELEYGSHQVKNLPPETIILTSSVQTQ
jgi:hypothetical protein